MLTDLALVGVQSWMSLARRQRRNVCKHFIRPLLFTRQAVVARTCLVVVAVVAATTLLRPSGFWHGFLTVFVVIFIATSLFDLAVVVWNRRRIDGFIQTHANEIQSQA